MIITFYSFKGGVGRSMALANVANWLRLQNLKVAVIDWDLEAPGLECFFLQTPARREEVQATPGLIDLLVSYKERFPQLPAEFFLKPGGDPTGPSLPPPLERRVELLGAALPPLQSLMVHLTPDNQVSGNQPTGSLAMLAPGLRDKERKYAYARDVQSFDWSELYSKYDGSAFFAWMRTELERDFDVTLIDSRTGMTEVGGVCTREMADLVLALCAANDQNLEGSALVVRSLFRTELNQMRGPRKLRAALIPARYDNGETASLLDFEKRLSTVVLDLKVASGDPAWRGLDPKTVWELRIPYTPKYAYRERLCVGAPDANPDLAAAYNKLSRFVASMYLESLDAEQRARVEALGPELRELAATDRPTEKLEMTLERAFATLSEHAQTNAAHVLCGFVDFLDPRDPSTVALQSREKADFAEDVQPLLDEFTKAQLLEQIHRTGSQSELPRWRVPFPKADSEWGRLSRWIADDVDFLMFRSELRKLELGNRERGLQPVSTRFLAAAEMWADRRHELSPRELLYLESLTGSPASLPKVPPKPWWRKPLAVGSFAAALGVLFVLVSSRPPPVTSVPPDVPSPDSSSHPDASTINADELLLKGRSFETVGDVEAAKRAYSTIIEASGASEQAKVAYIARGALLFQEQRYDVAEADFAHAEKLNPKDPALALQLGQTRARQGKPDEAIADLNRSIELVQGNPSADPKSSAAAYAELGDALHSADRVKEAVEAYTQAIRRRDDLSTAYYGRALAHLDLKENELAKANLAVVAAKGSDASLRDSAAAQLRTLGVKPPSLPAAPAVRRVFVQYVDPRDKPIVNQLIGSLGTKERSMQPAERTSPRTRGDVRCFFPSDRAAADALKQDTEKELARQGYAIQLSRLDLDAKAFPKATAGTIELWLPPLSTYGQQAQQALPKK